MNTKAFTLIIAAIALCGCSAGGEGRQAEFDTAVEAAENSSDCSNPWDPACAEGSSEDEVEADDSDEAEAPQGNKVIDFGFSFTPPKIIKPQFKTSENLELYARFYDADPNGELNGALMPQTQVKPNRFETEVLYVSDKLSIILEVKDQTGEYTFKSDNPLFPVHPAGCSEGMCRAYAIPSPKLASITEPQFKKVTFSVDSVATGDWSTITIKEVAYEVETQEPIDQKKTELICSDGKDDDGDGLIDCDDPDCEGTFDCPSDQAAINTEVIEKISLTFYLADIHVAHMEDDIDGGLQRPRGTMEIQFCKDRNFDECAKSTFATLDPIDSRKVTVKIIGLQGMSTDYLNYFRFNMVEGSYFFLQGLKVTYTSNESGGKEFTAYWNPCVNKVITFNNYPQSLMPMGEPGEIKFSRNDTAICSVVYTAVAEDGGTDSDYHLSIYGATSKYSELPKDSVKPDAFNYYSPVIRKSSHLSDMGLSLSMAHINDLEQGDVAGYGDYLFDCNPFSKKPCSKQRESDIDNHEFYDMGDKKVNISLFEEHGGYPAFIYDWYSAFIFRPGHIMKRDENSGTEYFDHQALYFTMDDNDNRIVLEQTNPKSEKCSMKTSPSITEHNFESLSDCYYYVGSEDDDQRCRTIIPTHMLNEGGFNCGS